MHKLSILDVNIDEVSRPEQEEDTIQTGTTLIDSRKKAKTTARSIEKLPEIVSPTWQNTNEFFKSKTSKNQHTPEINIEGMDTEGSRIFPEGEVLWQARSNLVDKLLTEKMSGKYHPLKQLLKEKLTKERIY